MFMLNTTDLHRSLTSILKSASMVKPQFIMHSGCNMVLSDVMIYENLLSAYHFMAEKFIEEDGSITLSLNELDLAVNAPDETAAKKLLGNFILDYAEDYYIEYPLWNTAPNRIGHVPYVLKALIADDGNRIGDTIECLNGQI